MSEMLQTPEAYRHLCNRQGSAMQISDWERFEAAGDCLRAAITILRDFARYIESDSPLETVKILDSAADELEALMDGLSVG